MINRYTRFVFTSKPNVVLTVKISEKGFFPLRPAAVNVFVHNETKIEDDRLPKMLNSKHPKERSNCPG